MKGNHIIIGLNLCSGFGIAPASGVVINCDYPSGSSTVTQRTASLPPTSPKICFDKNIELPLVNFTRMSGSVVM